MSKNWSWYTAIAPEIKQNWTNKQIKLSFLSQLQHRFLSIQDTEWVLLLKLNRKVNTDSFFFFPPVVKSRSCQDHGVVICPLRGVAPPRPGRVPVMAPRWITDDALWKTLPYDESKVHLHGGEMKDGHQANRLQRRTDMKRSKTGKGKRKRERFGKDWKISKVLFQLLCKCVLAQR